MINKNVVALYESLSAVNLKGIKVSYAVARNIGLLKPIIAAFQKSAEPAPEYAEFEKARMELCKELCVKDEKTGKPIMLEGNRFQFGDKKAEFDTKFTELKAKHDTAIKAREKQIEDFDKFINEGESEVTLYKVTVADLPEDITTKQLAGIIDMIEE